MRANRPDNKKLSKARDKAAGAERSVNAAKVELEGLYAERDDRMKEMVTAREAIAGAWKEEKSIKDRAHKASLEVELLMDTLKKNAELLKTVKEAAKQIEADAKAEAKKILADAESKVIVATKAANRLAKDRDALSRDVEALKKDKAAILMDIVSMRGEVEALSDEVGALRADGISLATEIAGLVKERDAARLSSGASTREMKTTEAALKKAEARLAKSKAEYKKQSNLLDQIFGDIEKAKGEEREMRKLLLVQSTRLKTIDKREADVERALKEAGLK